MKSLVPSTPRPQIILPIIIFLIFSRPSTADKGASYQTLTSLDAFGAIFPCARDCIAGWGGWGCGSGEWADNIAHAIGCEFNCKGASPYGARNSCYCRTDYMPTADSYLSACVKSRCVVGDYQKDLGEVKGLYFGYCRSLGYVFAEVGGETTTTGSLITTEGPGSTQTGTGSTGSTSDDTQRTTKTGTASSSPTGTDHDDSSPTPPADSLSPAAQAAIALGALLCVCIMGFALFLVWWRSKNADRLRPSGVRQGGHHGQGRVGTNVGTEASCHACGAQQQHMILAGPGTVPGQEQYHLVTTINGPGGIGATTNKVSSSRLLLGASAT